MRNRYCIYRWGIAEDDYAEIVGEYETLELATNDLELLCFQNQTKPKSSCLAQIDQSIAAILDAVKEWQMIGHPEDIKKHCSIDDSAQGEWQICTRNDTKDIQFKLKEEF